MKSLAILSISVVLTWCLEVLTAPAAVLYGPLVIFDGTNGANPAGVLVQGSDGLLYGTASAGGPGGAIGTVFRVARDGTQFTNLCFFYGTNGSAPAGGLIETADGAFYGTTYAGGVSNSGTIFRITTDGTLTPLVSFLTTNGSSPDTVLTPAGDGSFYGGAAYGGPSYPSPSIQGAGFGVEFNLATNGVLSITIPFARTNGSSPSQLLRAPDGNFYGATTWGGDTSFSSQGYGSIYRLKRDGTWTNIYNFSGGTDGGYVYGGIALGSDGSLYGVTYSGGTNLLGSLFRCTTNGQFTTLHAFTGGVDGANPLGPLLQGSDGYLYGTTYLGGSGFGALFRISPSGTGTTLVSFSGTGGSFPGGHSRGQLLQASDGNFYGVTLTGGTYNLGVLFRLSVPMPSRLLSFSQSNGLLSSFWSAVAGQNYQVQISTNLASGWSNFGSAFTATNGAIQISDSIGPDAQRYYRVALIP